MKDSFLIGIILVLFVSPTFLPADEPATLSTNPAVLKSLGTTYNRAQSADWLSNTRFVVGRWDGSISIFRPKEKVDEFGPVLTQSLVPPSKKGVQLVARISDTSFLSSNNAESIVHWHLGNGNPKCRVLKYDSKYGYAVSAARVQTRNGALIAVGHEQGFVSIWSIQPDRLRYLRAFSVRSSDPVDWEFQTWHVRGISAYAPGRIITVSEDGDICLVDLDDGKVLFRLRYNQDAQRGINDVAYRDGVVAIVNCSVGQDDKNLWIFKLENDQLTPVNSHNLIADNSRHQVFTFSIELMEFDEGLHFLATTEEGLLWLGRIENGQIKVDQSMKVASEGGAVLDAHEKPLTILSVAHKIQTFTLGPKTTDEKLEQPETQVMP